MSRKSQNLLSRLPKRFRWTAHNLIAHPASEILYQVGLESLGNWMHDVTVPTHKKGEGRG